jgi:hypothetical protein
VSYTLGSIDGVTTFCEMAVPIVSRLAEKLNLPANSPAAVDAARDKVGVCWVTASWGTRAALLHCQAGSSARDRSNKGSP